MTFSDASMASSSPWILWTFLWIFLNGGRLLRQFGNMYDQLTHYTIHYDWGWTCILSSILFAKYIFIQWFAGDPFCCWAPSLHICGNQSSSKSVIICDVFQQSIISTIFLVLSCLDVADWLVGKEACLLPVTHLHWSCSHCIGFHWGFF